MPFTTPPDATNGDPIASAHVNTLRDNSIWFNGLLQGPSAAFQVPISEGTSSARYGYLYPDSIQDGALETVKMVDGSVTTAKIANAAITSTELDSAVTARLVPSVLVGWVRKASEIPSGWSRESGLDGRMIVGDDNGVGVWVALNNYGSSWSHSHTASGTMSAENDTAADLDFFSGGTTAAHPTHSHTMSGSSNSTAWIPPSVAYVAVRKG